MATYNKTGTTVTSGVPSIGDLGPYNSGNSSYVLRREIDLTALTTAASTILTGDVFQCLPIPADTVVVNVFVKIVTAAVGTTLTLDVGDAGDPDDWDEDVDGKGTAGTVTYGISGIDVLCDDIGDGQGKLYTTADTIDVTVVLGTAITAGPKFEIYAICHNINHRSAT
jgi:hypothetical protein